MVALNIAYMSSRGIAVPIKKVSATVEKLASGKVVGRAYLGIVSHPIPIPKDVAKGIEIGQESGLIVLSVEAGSAAKAGGLSFGDIVLGLDGIPITGFHDLRRFLTEERIGKTLKVKVLRGGKVEELSVTPGSAPESE
jgi:S1-C subfamily serine protease